MIVQTSCRTPRPSPGPGHAPEHDEPVGVGLSRLEIDELAAFTRHDIMTAPTRELLRESWGLCPRHAWGQTAVELGLMHSTTAIAPRTFEGALLYDDLLRSARLMLASRWASPRRVLRPRGTCLMCGRIRHKTATEPGGSSASEPLLVARHLVTESEGRWRDRQCPACTRSRSRHVLCRPHLVEHGVDDKGATLRHLEELQRGLRTLIHSLGANGQGRDSDHSVWVEALGWFHGWEMPQFLRR